MIDLATSVVAFGKVEIANRQGKKIPEELKHHSTSIELLWDCGFRSPKKEMKVVKGIEGVIKYCNEFEEKRDNLPYEIDVIAWYYQRNAYMRNLKSKVK